MRTNVTPQLLHDLRSPLNQIIGYSEMLSDEAGEASREAVVVDLQRVRDAGRRMLALIEENFTAHHDLKLVAPGTEDDLPPAAEMPTPRDERAAAPGLLLVVDDDAANRDVLSRRLERQGHRLLTASSGRDALQLMRETEFDLVLLDILMPDMDGYEVLGHIKEDETLRRVPVIMISAIDEVQSVVRCIDAGADDYLAKPFDPTLLRARIGASLEKKRGRDREAALYAQLQENYTRLQEVEKLRDDMRNMIVHDLRTPLTAVIAGVEMLASHGELSESQRTMISIASGGGRTLLGMINDLLDVEKMESGASLLQYTQLSADTLVASALAQVGTLAEMEETSLLSGVDPGLPPFAGDESKLCRTLVNLIANAIKFTRAGTVSVSASQDDPRHIRFAIRDTGTGIPTESFDRIFEKFGQLGPGHRVGTGLGLTFCKLAVEAHGGTIDVESMPGVGSTFSFTIPVTQTL
ncbi:MAG TPA: response regulator [Thermoanaerobaculia bacterium]|nr:response regulator [Thermoanaerobaculia bacterium]